MNEVIDLFKIETKTLSYNEIIQYIFLNNMDRKRILLNLDKISNNKELFICCLDIFCKGLVYMHSKTGKKVIVNNLTEDDIQNTIDRISMTGIITIISLLSPIDAEELSDMKHTRKCIKESINNIHALKDDDFLHNFYFTLNVGNVIYKIKFDIIHIT